MKPQGVGQRGIDLLLAERRTVSISMGLVGKNRSKISPLMAMKRTAHVETGRTKPDRLTT